MLKPCKTHVNYPILSDIEAENALLPLFMIVQRSKKINRPLWIRMRWVVNQIPKIPVLSVLLVKKADRLKGLHPDIQEQYY